MTKRRKAKVVRIATKSYHRYPTGRWTQPTWYFAYGSNMDPVQMARRAPTAKYVGAATLADWKLVFKGVADIIPAEGEKVVGSLWHCLGMDMNALDSYEGWPTLYTSRALPVRSRDQTVLAEVYHMTPSTGGTDVDDDFFLPSRGYLRGIADGYRFAGLPAQPLIDAIAATNRHLKTAWPDVTHVRPRGKRAIPVLTGKVVTTRKEPTESLVPGMVLSPVEGGPMRFYRSDGSESWYLWDGNWTQVIDTSLSPAPYRNPNLFLWARTDDGMWWPYDLLMPTDMVVDIACAPLNEKARWEGEHPCFGDICDGECSEPQDCWWSSSWKKGDL